jgi:hypothetical protein
MIPNRVISKPGWVFEHGKPPLLKHTFHGTANIFGADSIDQCLWAGTFYDNTILTNNVPLYDPIAA